METEQKGASKLNKTISGCGIVHTSENVLTLFINAFLPAFCSAATQHRVPLPNYRIECCGFCQTREECSTCLQYYTSVVRYEETATESADRLINLGLSGQPDFVYPVAILNSCTGKSYKVHALSPAGTFLPEFESSTVPFKSDKMN